MGTFRDSFKKSAAQLERERSDEEIKKTIEALKSSLEEIQAGKSKKERNETATSIQLLISHYLGFLQDVRNEINDSTKTAYLLSILFNKEGVENLRKKLSNVGGRDSELLTVKNLAFIKDLFEKIGLVEPLAKVKKDLDRIGGKN
jgi:ribosomal protein S17E